MNLLSKSVNRKFQKGTIKEVATIFSISNRTVSHIWKRAKQSSESDTVNVNHRRSKNCGRKRIQIDPEQFKKIHLSWRTSLKSLAHAIYMSRSTLHRNYQDGRIPRHNNPVKPHLKDSNKRTRVQFYLSMINKNGLPQDPHFVNMYNMIHNDEKWFYISKKARRCYLLFEECNFVRTCKNSIFLTYVMFLAAIT